MRTLTCIVFSLAALAGAASHAGTITVPGDHTTIQAALDAAEPGDTIQVAAGTYSEALVFTNCGLTGQPITLMGAPGDPTTPGAVPAIDTAGTGAANAILIEDCSHVRVIRFTIRDHAVPVGQDGSAVRVIGSGTDIQIRGLVIREITGTDAMAITVYGTEPTALSDVVIADNVIRDIEAAPSEAVTLNGNVDGFLIENNVIRDVNNIGIDLIGGETDIQPDTALVARNGIVRGNEVRAATAASGFAAGIYVDGGRDILLEANVVEGCDLGIEVGAENAGIVASGVVVRNNQIAASGKAGLVVGGFDVAAGRTDGVVLRGNTLVGNNVAGESGGGIGEIWVQWADDTLIEHNLVQAAPPLTAPFDVVYVANHDVGSASGTTIDHNLYWSTDPDGPTPGFNPGDGLFVWNGADYPDLAAWQTAGLGFDAATLHQDPLLMLDLETDHYHLTSSSPAVDAVPSGFVPPAGSIDIDYGERRNGSAVDLGADELGAARIFADGFELGDFTAWIPEAP